jgi:hypothetical protein
MTEPSGSYETLVNIYLTTRRHTPDDGFLNSHHHRNVKSH